MCFTCTCSFKKPEKSPVDFQERGSIVEKYHSVLQGRRPQDHRHALSVETPE